MLPAGDVWDGNVAVHQVFIEVLCSADTDERCSAEFVLHSLWNIQASAARYAADKTDRGRTCRYERMYSIFTAELVDDGLGIPSERDVAVVQSRRHEGVD